jgi:hypothetical protein
LARFGSACVLQVVLGLGLWLSVAGPTQSQSLGEVARREQAKKKEKKKGTPAVAAPAFTAEDLESGRANARRTLSTLEEPVAAVPAGAVSTEASPSPEPDRRILEQQWRERFADARARIAQADARAWEDRIEVVFVSGIPVQQRVRVKVETPELQQARQAFADLEEELRRAGLPPGWGRE